MEIGNDNSTRIKVGEVCRHKGSVHDGCAVCRVVWTLCGVAGAAAAGWLSVGCKLVHNEGVAGCMCYASPCVCRA